MCHVALPQCQADLKRSHSDPALAKVAEEEGEEGDTAEDEERRYPGVCVVSIQGHRQVCKSGGGAGYMQIFGYSPHKVQCTAVLFDRINLKTLAGSPIHTIQL